MSQSHNEPLVTGSADRSLIDRCFAVSIRDKSSSGKGHGHLGTGSQGHLGTGYGHLGTGHGHLGTGHGYLGTGWHLGTLLLLPAVMPQGGQQEQPQLHPDFAQLVLIPRTQQYEL